MGGRRQVRSSGQGSPRVRRTYTWQTHSQAQDHRQQAVRTEEVLQPTGPSGTWCSMGRTREVVWSQRSRRAYPKQNANTRLALGFPNSPWAGKELGSKSPQWLFWISQWVIASCCTSLMYLRRESLSPPDLFYVQMIPPQ